MQKKSDDSKNKLNQIAPSHHPNVHVRHRKDDSDRGVGNENCVFSSLHKHHYEDQDQENCDIKESCEIGSVAEDVDSSDVHSVSSNPQNNYQCSLSSESDKMSDTSGKDSDNFFMNSKNMYSKYDLNHRKSPKHGKAPRNDLAAFHSVEPSSVSEYPVNKDVEHQQPIKCPSDNSLSEDNDEVLKSDSPISDNRFVNNFESKESEDSRNFTQRRSLRPRTNLSDQKLNNSSNKTNQSSKKSSARGTENSNARLLRSQKRELSQPVNNMNIGGDDDSGIQGDIYEFSEKESNLEDVTLPTRKYNETKFTNSVPMQMDSWDDKEEMSSEEEESTSESEESRNE